jgi:hypothetical protein
MFIRDIDKKCNVVLITQDQEVKQILQDLNCDEAYGGIFVFDGGAWGFEGQVPYLGLEIHYLGPYGND